MSPRELFELWAPPESIWSPWTKPVLFANAPLGGALVSPNWPDVDVPAPFSSDTALVLELPGRLSIACGVALARKGFRPVPLFNCAPGSSAAIPWEHLAHGLAAGADHLGALALPPDAPPVFLLDSLRLKPTTPLFPGTFDNRWVVFAQDFPSGGFLLAHGIRRVLLIHDENFATPQNDLAHILFRWQEARLELLHSTVPGAGHPSPLVVTKPGEFRAMLYRILVAMGLRKNSAGGFGGVIPHPSSSGGYG